MNDDHATVEVLRRESERTRAELAGTVTELRERVSDTASEIKTMVSPAHIKEEIRSFVRQERESLRQSLERRVRDNPLQAAAIGAALAYPALGLLRAIPAPLLMIGAGLFLTSARGKKTMADASAKASDVFDQGMTAASEIAGDLRDAAARATEPVTHALDQAGAAITEQTDAIAMGIRRNVRDAQDSVSQAASTVAHKVTDTYRRTEGGINTAAKQSSGAVMNWVDQNPLVVAGVGAAVGAFIAAALPPSSAENTALGQSSDRLKDRARDLATEGLEKAKDVAADVASQVEAAAAREGLDTASLRQTVDGITDGVKSVAERGLKTALQGTALETQPTQHN